MEERPKIGTAIIIHDGNGNVLLSKRSESKAVGGGTYQFCGGHLEMFESLNDCVLREKDEEVGTDMVIGGIEFLGVSNNPFKEQGKHYVTLRFLARRMCGEPQSVNGHGPWFWAPVDNLPQPLFEGGLSADEVERILKFKQR